MMRETFTGTRDFEAVGKAEDWCRERGLSVGSAERGSPRGILLGDVTIAKWRNLTATERAQLHGQMSGDMRNGPVHVDLKPIIAKQVGA